MFSSVVIDYLQRFSSVMSQSVFASRGIEDYNKMKRYCDYLDYDRQSLFRDKNKTQSGLRNIGNTCYLNVILQLLYHINYLREKVCSSEHENSKLLHLLRGLFGQMALGKLLFADPSDLFEHLKDTNPDLFVPGVQNDFHEIFTLLIDKISEGYKEISPEEARFINKLLFGRMITKIDFEEGVLSKTSLFNIINLDSTHGNFEKAFEAWRHYSLDYTTPKGSSVQAKAENVFLETPALMIFFINRVTYKSGKLEKDNKVFDYDESILISKSQPSQKTQMLRSQNRELEKELLEEKKYLNEWLIKIETERSAIEQTLNYLRSKETPLLQEPMIINQLGEKSLISSREYLKKEIDLIDKKVQDVQAEVKAIDKKIASLEEEGNYEKYVLWALMIHEGTSAVSGHYKICINVGEDKWNEYNDRIVTPISKQRIENYKKRGEICCLFYRRPVLECNLQRIPVTLSLKNFINREEKQTRKEIDKARLLQLLYQQTESANILLDHQVREGMNNRYQYFFKPVHFAITNKVPYQCCKGIIINDSVSSEAFKIGLAAKMVSQEEVILPKVKFGIPEEYFLASEVLKKFMNKERNLMEVPRAYSELSCSKVKFIHKAIRERYEQMLQVIILKGLYYLHLFSAHSQKSPKGGFAELNAAIDKLLETMGNWSEFSLVCIAIKSSLKGGSSHMAPHQSTIRNSSIDNYGDYFHVNYHYWIHQRAHLSQIDEGNFTLGAPVLPWFKQ